MSRILLVDPNPGRDIDRITYDLFINHLKNEGKLDKNPMPKATFVDYISLDKAKEIFSP